MLTITIPETECYDQINNLFFTIKSQTITMEHSLVSISKWESKWKRPFLEKKPKSNAEMQDYYRCMTLTQNVDPIIYSIIPKEQIKEINRYIEDPMTASTVKEEKKNGSGKITSELIYYWMVALEIPFECQKWHLNRLLMLIRICQAKNAPQKKMSKKDVANQYRALNEQRKAALHTTG